MRRRRHVSRLFAFVAVLVALASSARAEPGLQPDAPIRVGIISFTGPFSQQYIQYGANCLSDALIRVGRFQVVQRANIERILAELRFQMSGSVDPHNVASIRSKSATDSPSVSKACLDAVGACFGSSWFADRALCHQGTGAGSLQQESRCIYVGRESGVKPGAHLEILRPSVTQIGGMQLSDDSSLKESIAVVQVIEVSGAIARAKVVESAKDIHVNDYAV